MVLRNTWKRGDWLYVCQRCGLTYYASTIRLEWTGLRVCEHCWEPRHPQDFVRGVRDDQTVPFANNPDDVFVEANEVSHSEDQVLSPSGDVVLSPSGNAVISES